jgi:hypothetical protein
MDPMLQPDPVCLLIADISGYTAYLAGVELDHSQDILADLIGTVVTALRPTFRLAKLVTPRSSSHRPPTSTARSSSTRSSAATSGSAGAAATCARRRHAPATHVSGSPTSTSSS